jgi:hypothetical protein
MFAVNSALPMNRFDTLAKHYAPLILNFFGYKQHSSELPNVMDHPRQIRGSHSGDCEEHSLLCDDVTTGKCVLGLLNDTVNCEDYTVLVIKMRTEH